MNIKIEQKKAGEDLVNLIIVQNKRGFEVVFTDFGAALYSIAYPNRKGELRHVLNCPKSLDTFVHSGCCYGKAVGRVAGRLKDAKAIVGDKVYDLDQNEGKNILHGGYTSFWKRRYNFKIRTLKNKTDIVFSIKSKAGESGFPGNVSCQVIYTIPENRKEIKMRFKGKTDEPTLLNLTSHIYVNLNGGFDTILDHQLYLRCPQVAKLDDGLIIQGYEDVPTYLDYTKLTTLRDNVRSEILQNHRAKGMDHVFKFENINSKVPSAILYDPSSKRKMTLFTNYPGVVVYTENFPTYEENLVGVKDDENFGITFETVIPTDDYEAITFTPEKPYDFFAIYKFN